MSVVDFLKSVGAVTLPDDVIQRAYRSNKKVAGRLILSQGSNGSILLTFAPSKGAGVSRPLLAKDAGQAESDLVTNFGLSRSEARAQIAELTQKAQVDVAVSVEEGLASELFLSRQ